MKITLCGSTKFMDLYHEADKRLTLAGHLVYSVATSAHKDWMPSQEEKAMLDVVHLMKIQASLSILVISDRTGYIGESTEREICFARMLHRRIYYFQNVEDCNQLARGWGTRSHGKVQP